MISKQDKGKTWDRVYKKGTPWEGKVSKAAKNLSKLLKEKSRILDIGCGSGDDSIFLVKKGFQVWGIDISKLALKKAKSANNLKNLKLSFGDSENLKFKDNFFDAVLCMWVLHSKTANLEKSSKEIYRVLKRGGIAIVGVILNIKYTRKKIEKYKNKEEILKAFQDFRILRKREFESNDKYAKQPHKHDVLILYLKK